LQNFFFFFTFFTGAGPFLARLQLITQLTSKERLLIRFLILLSIPSEPKEHLKRLFVVVDIFINQTNVQTTKPQTTTTTLHGRPRR
jgi:hypothetical protein